MIRNPNRLKWIRRMNSLPDTPLDISIGDKSEIHPTSIIGIPGFSAERDDEGRWIRCKHHGGVVIGNDVFIGPYCIVKRSTLKGTATEIRDGSYLSCFVNVGHNCKIGKNVFIGPHVAFNGSVEVGNNSWISSHVTINQHVKIGEFSVVGSGSVVTRDVPARTVVAGVPAKFLRRVES